MLFFFCRPVPLTTIVKYMCLSSSEEMAKMVFTTASDASALLYESPIAPRNELRALKWCAWLLAQVCEDLSY